MHQVDEHISISHLKDLTKLYTIAIEALTA